MTTPTDTNADIVRLHIDTLITILTDPQLDLSDNEIINIAFNVYTNLIVRIIQVCQEDDKVNMAEHIRDASLEQVQKYIDVLMKQCPRRKVTLN